MPIVELTPQRLVARSGSTTLTLSKAGGRAVMQRKFLFWKIRSAETPLSDIVNVSVHAGVDRASGVEVCKTILVLRTGAAWPVPCSDKKDAQATTDAIRDFLGIAS